LIETTRGYRLFPKDQVPGTTYPLYIYTWDFNLHATLGNYKTVFAHALLAEPEYVTAFNQTAWKNSDIHYKEDWEIYHIPFWSASIGDHYWVHDKQVYCGSLEDYNNCPSPKSDVVFPGSPGAYPCEPSGKRLGR
jgi:hypothetical protein